MKDLITLYSRYDGPLPRQVEISTDRCCVEQILNRQLYTIRLRRRGCRDLEQLAPLVRRAGGTLKILKRSDGSAIKQVY